MKLISVVLSVVIVLSALLNFKLFFDRGQVLTINEWKESQIEHSNRSRDFLSKLILQGRAVQVNDFEENLINLGVKYSTNHEGGNTYIYTEGLVFRFQKGALRSIVPQK